MDFSFLFVIFTVMQAQVSLELFKAFKKKFSVSHKDFSSPNKDWILATAVKALSPNH